MHVRVNRVKERMDCTELVTAVIQSTVRRGSQTNALDAKACQEAARYASICIDTLQTTRAFQKATTNM